MGLFDWAMIKPEDGKQAPKQEPVKETSKTKFPTTEQTPESKPEATEQTSFFGFGKSTPSFTPQPTAGQPTQEDIEKTLSAYQEGFDRLNQPGYDFYEFYQAIMAIGAENNAAYPMAYQMGKATDKSVTKDKLVNQSDYYSSAILKSYNDIVSQGNGKKQELLAIKAQENQSLVGELDLMMQNLEALKIQISDRENKLKAIDSKYQPQLNSIDSKLGANEMIKDKILTSINQVKQGIINNVK